MTEKMELPEDGNVAPVEVGLSGGGGAGRFGRVRVCGTTAGVIKIRSAANRQTGG